MATEKEFQASTANSTVLSNAGDVILAAASGKGVYSTVGGVLQGSLLSGDWLLKSHTAFTGSGIHIKTFGVATADATVTTIASIACPLSTTLQVLAIVCGKKVGTSADAFVGISHQGVSNAAATTAVIGTTTVVSTLENSAGTPLITMVANDATDALEVKVTGIAAENWAWTAICIYQLVATAT